MFEVYEHPSAHEDAYRKMWIHLSKKANKAKSQSPHIIVWILGWLLKHNSFIFHWNELSVKSGQSRLTQSMNQNRFTLIFLSNFRVRIRRISINYKSILVFKQSKFVKLSASRSCPCNQSIFIKMLRTSLACQPWKYFLFAIFRTKKAFPPFHRNPKFKCCIIIAVSKAAFPGAIFAQLMLFAEISRLLPASESESEKSSSNANRPECPV